MSGLVVQPTKSGIGKFGAKLEIRIDGLNDRLDRRSKREMHEESSDGYPKMRQGQDRAQVRGALVLQCLLKKRYYDEEHLRKEEQNNQRHLQTRLNRDDENKDPHGIKEGLLV